ncbi:ADP-ribosylglycohydrolase family protein [Paraburkholderia sp. GAS448]|uniref:ADP-ribosylglycohydrolase family protein n=1 Tax=Paraburkholderia sp. GAS448 TaxID=3035136 RepID=UPI003D1A9375
MASRLECGRFALTDFAGKLLRWVDDGYLAVDGDVFDRGIQTAEAMSKLRDGVSPRESGGAHFDGPACTAAPRRPARMKLSGPPRTQTRR